MIGWLCVRRRYLRSLVLLCLVGALVAYAQPAKRFIRLYFDVNPNPDEMSLADTPGAWYEYPTLGRWVSESELQAGRVELGKLSVSRKLYVAAEFDLSPLEFNNARLDASAWEETTPIDAVSAEPGWASDTLDGAPCLMRSFRYKKPIVLEWDRKLYLTIATVPQGARVYVRGRYVDSVPADGLTLSYPLRAADYKRGYVVGDSFTLVRYGYQPQPVQYRFALDPAKEQTQPDIQRYQPFALVRDQSVPDGLLVPPAYVRPSSPQYDARRAGEYNGAVADYEQALVEWESAMKGCTKAGLDAKAIDKAAASQASAGPSAMGETGKRLWAAREKLEQLKVRLRALDR
jgi:hypothetical protein